MIEGTEVMEMLKTQISVGPLSDFNSEGNPQRVTLIVEYADKEAHIELSVPKPRFDQQPGLDAYRRELFELMGAVREWEESRGAITWQRFPRA